MPKKQNVKSTKKTAPKKTAPKTTKKSTKKVTEKTTKIPTKKTAPKTTKLTHREKKIIDIKKKLLAQKKALLLGAIEALNELPGQTAFPDLGDQATAEIDRNFMLRIKGRYQLKLNYTMTKNIEQMMNQFINVKLSPS